MGLFAFKGFVAYSLRFEWDWAITVGLIDAIVGVIVCIINDKRKMEEDQDIRSWLLINLSSMADCNDGHDKAAVVDLIDDAVIADADAPGVAAF